MEEFNTKIRIKSHINSLFFTYLANFIFYTSLVKGGRKGNTKISFGFWNAFQILLFVFYHPLLLNANSKSYKHKNALFLSKQRKIISFKIILFLKFSTFPGVSKNRIKQTLKITRKLKLRRSHFVYKLILSGPQQGIAAFHNSAYFLHGMTLACL